MRWLPSALALSGAGGAWVAACGGPEFKAAPVDVGSDGSPPLYFAPDAARGPDATVDATGDGPVSPADGPVPVGDRCSGDFACQPAAPDGWSGPLELYSGMAVAPDCGGGFGPVVFDGNDALTSDPASCRCECGAPHDVECDVPTISFYPAEMCSAPTCLLAGPLEGSCQAFNLVGCVDGGPVGTVSMTVLPSSLFAPVGGSCTPSLVKTIPTTTWTSFARACSSSLAMGRLDCTAGAVCAPVPASPYRSSLCVSHAGDVPCPTTAYTARQRFFASTSDTRDCTACTCASPTGLSCKVDIDTYSSTDGSCTGTDTTYVPPFNCEPVAGHADYRVTTKSAAGSCMPSAVSAVGSVTPTEPTTFCCLP